MEKKTMDWNLSEEQTQVRDLARQILGDLVTNDTHKAHEAGKIRLHEIIWKALTEANLTGVAIPEQYGGMGMDFLSLALLAIEEGRTTAPAPIWTTLVMGGMTITTFGNDAQKQAWLPGIAEGSTHMTAALTELESTDPLHPLTTAKRDGETFVIDGVKSLVPGVQLAHGMLVPASTADGSVGVFIVDPKADGVRVEHQGTSCGNPHGHVTLDGVRVGADALVGELSRDARVLRGLRAFATAGLCAMQLGVSERSLEMTAEYARERVQFDRPIGSFQAVHQRAADAYIQTEGLRLATLEACWRLGQALDATDHLRVAKFWAAEGGQFTAYACQHLHGGIGIDVDYPLHRYFLWSTQVEHTLGSAPAQLADLGAQIAAHGLPAF
jgi:alkylation response protein AidB-like acyl-CoA dehydrogenase